MKSWGTALFIAVLVYLIAAGCSQQEVLFIDIFWNQDLL